MTEQSKSAIVTGASRGIGRAIALRLARDGFGVAVNFVGTKAKAEEVAKEITDAGGRAFAVQADVANPADVERLFTATEERLGPIHAVISNAGYMPTTHIADADLAAFDKTIAVNLRGTFIVLGQAARRVVDGGRIIAMSSSSIGPAFPGYGPYIASKAGVEGLVRVLANELRGRNITANAVAPGPVGTDLFYAGKSKERIEQMSKLPPLERLGRPEDIASVVSYLVGPDGGWINAQVIRANGGYV